MKPVCLSLAVLLCVSIAQAAPTVYDFNNLNGSTVEPYPYLDNQVDGEVTWQPINLPGQVAVRQDLGGNKFATSNSQSSEQLITKLTNYPTKTSLFNLNSTDTKLRLSWEGKFNKFSGWMVGIWEDGIDALPNTTAANELEHVVQFGVDIIYQSWRLRGANGNPTSDANYRDTTGIPFEPNGVTTPMRVTLDIDLLGNGGDGAMSLTVKNLNTDIETQPPNLQNESMMLLTEDPNHTTYGDPSKWTGWYVRNYRIAGGDDIRYTVGMHTLDNLTLEVVPEPATMSLIVLGGLICLRRSKVIRPGL